MTNGIPSPRPRNTHVSNLARRHAIRRLHVRKVGPSSFVTNVLEEAISAIIADSSLIAEPGLRGARRLTHGDAHGALAGWPPCKHGDAVGACDTLQCLCRRPYSSRRDGLHSGQHVGSMPGPGAGGASTRQLHQPVGGLGGDHSSDRASEQHSCLRNGHRVSSKPELGARGASMRQLHLLADGLGSDHGGDCQ